MPSKNFRAPALILWMLALLAPHRVDASPPDRIIEPAPYGHPLDEITFEPIPDTPDWGRVESINGDKLYPYDDDLEEVDLIVFYHGVGYGTQSFVMGDEEYGLGAAMASSGFNNHTPDVLEAGVLVLVPRGPTRAWSKVEETIQVLEEERGIHIRSITVGGWSGGAVGLTTAVASGGDFRAILYADPSPESRTLAYWPKEPRIEDPSMLVNWYRPENWGRAHYPGGWYGDKNPRLLRRLSDAGGVSYTVDIEHNEILLLSLVTAIQIAQMDPDT